MKTRDMRHKDSSSNGGGESLSCVPLFVLPYFYGSHEWLRWRSAGRPRSMMSGAIEKQSRIWRPVLRFGIPLHRLGDDVLEKASFQFAAVDAPRDKHNPRPVIVIGPGVKHDWGMKDVMDTVNRHRRTLAD